ncbi:MAG: hypothetical protein QOF84_6505 [Streptomyces sp.]|nr:hypothetical protein [Streptomyces sp.]
MSGMRYQSARPRPHHLPFRNGSFDPIDAAGIAALSAIVGEAKLAPVWQRAAEPFAGITTDGTVVPGLFTIADEGFDVDGVVRAARAYLDGLHAGQRPAASAAIDGPEWRLWINAFLTFPSHGLLLEELTERQRSAALAVIAATLSAAGHGLVRDAMQLNGRLGELCAGYPDTLTEWKYWFTLFGTPSRDEPWGWQLMGHHLDVNCLILGRQIVLTPSFVGTEFDGEQLFADHIRAGVELMTSLAPAQRDAALLYPSIRSADLPRALSGAADGRTRAGAGQDNLILPYEGIAGDRLSPGQRELLVNLIRPYLAVLPSGPMEARLEQVRRHLDDTHFAWIGGWGESEPCYYKIHSPVLIVEYDNHSGIFLDNDEPEQYHVHSVVRTPNGNDYGKDLLRQHYARFH